MLCLLWVVIVTPVQLAFWNPIFTYDIDPAVWESVEVSESCGQSQLQQDCSHGPVCFVVMRRQGTQRVFWVRVYGHTIPSLTLI